ncbi:hypothetical protein MRB53_039572 [Persea americana]|nr:hypothetical protein MRB53_039572 [Persea americana]
MEHKMSKNVLLHQNVASASNDLDYDCMVSDERKTLSFDPSSLDIGAKRMDDRAEALCAVEPAAKSKLCILMIINPFDISKSYTNQIRQVRARGGEVVYESHSAVELEIMKRQRIELAIAG